jgi:threonine/homoserine/homoserine lactone efflux protein
MTPIIDWATIGLVAFSAFLMGMIAFKADTLVRKQDGLSDKDVAPVTNAVGLYTFFTVVPIMILAGTPLPWVRLVLVIIGTCVIVYGAKKLLRKLKATSLEAQRVQQEYRKRF